MESNEDFAKAQESLNEEIQQARDWLVSGRANLEAALEMVEAHMKEVTDASI